MQSLRAAVFAALFLLVQTIALVAQDITLTSRDGSVEITGTFLGFDGDFYRLDTVYGELTVDSSGVLCEGPACPNLIDYVAELRFSGAGTMGEVLLPALVEGFALRSGHSARRINGEAGYFTYELTNRNEDRLAGRFHFRLTTTDEGFADLMANEADIVMSLREVRAEEARLARAAGMGDLGASGRGRVVALDALVPLVSPDNPVSQIATPDLARVFAGKIANWSVLGGPDAPISLHLRDRKTGLGQAVMDRLLKPISADLGAEAVEHENGPELARIVAADPFAIGFGSASETGNAKRLALSGSCGFALPAVRRTIKTEDYPLTAPMFLYLPARRLPQLGREFMTYLRSAPAQLVMRRAGFTDQAPEEIAINLQGDRFANAITSAGEETGLRQLQAMVTRLRGFDRLSTTFRFEAGSTRLDAQSRSNVEQLARALEAGTYDARELLFVGFSDGDGSATANREISRRRALAVQEAVKMAAETANFDRMTLGVAAFGEALPMACDDSAWGRQVNRRVEVWVN